MIAISQAKGAATTYRLALVLIAESHDLRTHEPCTCSAALHIRYRLCPLTPALRHGGELSTGWMHARADLSALVPSYPASALLRGGTCLVSAVVVSSCSPPSSCRFQCPFDISRRRPCCLSSRTRHDRDGCLTFVLRFASSDPAGRAAHVLRPRLQSVAHSALRQVIRKR